jgi:hypothetical protein
MRRGPQQASSLDGNLGSLAQVLPHSQTSGDLTEVVRLHSDFRRGYH